MIYFTTDVLAENVLYTKESQIFKWFDEGKLIHHTVADDGIEGDFVEFFNLIDFVINESMIMKSNIYVSRLYRWINRNRKFVKEELPDFLKSETFKKIKCISNIPDTKDFYILYESIYDITDDSKIEIIEPDRNFVKNFIVLKVAGNNDIIDVREICTNNISYIKHWYGKKYVCYKSEFKYKFYSDCDVLSERLKKFLHLVRTTHPNAGFDSNDPYFDSISVAKKLSLIVKIHFFVISSTTFPSLCSASIRKSLTLRNPPDSKKVIIPSSIASSWVRYGSNLSARNKAPLTFTKVSNAVSSLLRYGKIAPCT